VPIKAAEHSINEIKPPEMASEPSTLKHNYIQVGYDVCKKVEPAASFLGNPVLAHSLDDVDTMAIVTRDKINDKIYKERMEDKFGVFPHSKLRPKTNREADDDSLRKIWPRPVAVLRKPPKESTITNGPIVEMIRQSKS
jgi:hypothetical protein